MITAIGISRSRWGSTAAATSSFPDWVLRYVIAAALELLADSGLSDAERGLAAQVAQRPDDAASRRQLLASLEGGAAEGEPPGGGRLGATSLAQDALSPRLQIGINLLPAIVAANQSLAATDINRHLPIYLVYREDRYQAEQLKPRINQVGKIHPVDIGPNGVSHSLYPDLVPFSPLIRFGGMLVIGHGIEPATICFLINPSCPGPVSMVIALHLVAIHPF